LRKRKGGPIWKAARGTQHKKESTVPRTKIHAAGEGRIIDWVKKSQKLIYRNEGRAQKEIGTNHLGFGIPRGALLPKEIRKQALVLSFPEGRRMSEN